MNSEMTHFLSLCLSEGVLLLIIFAVSGVVLRRVVQRGWADRAHQPPGPPALPIVGHLHLLGELPHQSLCNLSQKYGPLMGLRLGSATAVVASSPQMAKELLQTHDAHLAYRPQTAAAVHLCFGSSDMAFSPLGPRWRFLRQLYATKLFSAKQMESFRSVREGEVRALARAVQRQSRRPVEVRLELATAANNISSLMAMGKRLTEVSGPAGGKQDLAGLVKEILHLSGVFYVGDYIPWLAWLDPNRYLQRMKDSAKRVVSVLQAVIDDRRQQQQRQRQREQKPGSTPAYSGEEMPLPPRQDLLDALFAAACDNHMGEDVSITDKDIMAAILDVFLGASDTVATAVEWALAELINHPQTMRKVQEELDRVVGRERLVEEGDIPNLAYLGCVITESMHLHPVVPLLIPRQSVRECVVCGFTVEAGTLVYVNAWAIGRDSETWPNPHEFLPERFLHSGVVGLTSRTFEFLPFGMGRRRCPGVSLGIANVHLMLATLAQAFEWKCESTVDMSEMFGLTLNMATPLRAIATPRLPLQLLL